VLSDKASDDEREQLGARFAADTGQAGVTVPEDASKSELYEQAKDADIPGRSSMTKDELAQAISEKGA
jgi:Rho termination factor, N-terminal domain